MRRPVSLAESIYCAHVAGGDADVESLCARNPELADALRACHAQHEAALAALRVTVRDGGDRESGRYEVVGEIGRGGMGSVVEARDAILGRSVAMKLPRAGAGVDGLLGLVLRERARSRLVSEAQILAQLHHPGMVPVHDVGVDREGSPFFTMLLVRGRHFGQVIGAVHAKERHWPLARAVDALQRACAAIAFAHAHGVVHRDLKPENIMLGDEGQVYVLDWGLAFERAHRIHAPAAGEDRPPCADAAPASVHTARRDMREHTPDSPFLTADGEVVGTPAYMAPEQAEGSAAANDPRVDVYGVGAVLYQLLSGSRPYAELGDIDPVALVHHVRRAPPRPLPAVARDAPDALVAIAAKAMARTPDQRYPTMGALAADLRAFLEVRPVAAHRTGAWSELRLWLARNRGAAIALGATLSIAIVALLAVLQTQHAAEAEVRQAGFRQSAATLQAQTRASEATARAAAVLLPADQKRLEELLAQQRALGPAHPANAAAIAAWIEAACALLDRRSVHDAALSALRQRARGAAAASVEANRRVALRGALVDAERARDAAFGNVAQAPADRSAQAAAIAAAERVEALREAIDTASLWQFDSPQDQWQHDALAQLQEGLEALVPRVERERQRLAFATTVRERTLTGAAARTAWQEASAAIADARVCPAYAGLRIEPQLGLLPIGRDPRSGLYEFAHLESGEPATRDSTGKLHCSEASGLVLVLVPGGEAWLGSQNENRRSPNFDPHGHVAGRVRRVRVPELFLAKLEMTQAQWLRVTGSNPSYLAPGRNHELAQPVTLLHPVGMLSFNDAEYVVHRLGLRLPTDDEWEYAARAGTTTVYSTGDTPATLFGTANVADAAARQSAIFSADRYAPRAEAWADFDDGFANTAPVGSFAANAFGLHDVHGNITEWVRGESATTFSLLRGGGALYPPGHARSGFPLHQPPEYPWVTFGVRPARGIEGGEHGRR